MMMMTVVGWREPTVADNKGRQQQQQQQQQRHRTAAAASLGVGRGVERRAVVLVPFFFAGGRLRRADSAVAAPLAAGAGFLVRLGRLAGLYRAAPGELCGVRGRAVWASRGARSGWLRRGGRPERAEPVRVGPAARCREAGKSFRGGRAAERGSKPRSQGPKRWRAAVDPSPPRSHRALRAWRQRKQGVFPRAGFAVEPRGGRHRSGPQARRPRQHAAAPVLPLWR
mmetsp:Transcript_32023/g.65210  ORF Transcript_32023/g.65210 Transcript_32023/m.65210 type:complete len:226 (+) Transcript_32023:1848-2525(+)